MNEWIPVCALDDIAVLAARQLRVGELRIALVRSSADQLTALEDRCPHKGGPFSEGIVSHDRVACPLHGQCVDLATGEMVAPDEGRVRRFAVQIADGQVLMDRAELRAAAQAAPAVATPCNAACAA